jgi:hypothetical protein
MLEATRRFSPTIILGRNITLAEDITRRSLTVAIGAALAAVGTLEASAVVMAAATLEALAVVTAAGIAERRC